MSRDPLPRSTPAAEGVSAAGIDAFLDAVEADPALELHSLMVLRHGRVVAEGWWSPHRPDDARQLYSLSKSFTATALGLALAEGRLALTDRVVDHFPELAPAAGPRARSITLDHLARMATGHTEDTVDRLRARDPAEPVRWFLGLEPESPPGSVFTYNNGATYVLGAVLQRVTGESLTGYLQPRLFGPLGIDPPVWDTLGGPRQIGWSGLRLTTEDIARFGLLYLTDDSTVLPVGWVGEATRVHTPTTNRDEPDWQQGYGYQFWRSRHGYRADGAFGQLCLVLPDHDAVVVITAGTEAMQTLLDAVWAQLRPALAGPGTDEDDHRLAGRLTTLAVPSDGSADQPADSWLAARGVAATEDGWALTVEADGRNLVVECGDEHWRRGTLPVSGDRGLVVACRGSWRDPGTFVAELVFVQGPHRMTVTYRPADDRSDARWRTVPLGVTTLAGLAPDPVQEAGSPR